jgi:hypothetical protein
MLFDQPSASAGAKARMAAEGLAGRCAVVGGDFFTAVLRGGDVYLLKNIIHDWEDEQALEILVNCSRAMGPQSKIILIEDVIKPGNEPSFGKLADVEMLVLSGGRERTAREYHALLTAAGFEPTRLLPTQAAVSLIEAVKP